MREARRQERWRKLKSERSAKGGEGKRKKITGKRREGKR